MSFPFPQFRVLLSLALGTVLCAQGHRACIFNRCGTRLRLSPKASASRAAGTRFQVITHDLPRFEATRTVLDFTRRDVPAVDLEAESLAYIFFAREGELMFELLAEQDAGPEFRRIGTLVASASPVQGQTEVQVKASLEDPFWADSAPASPWHVVIKIHDPEQEVRERDRDAEVAAAVAEEAKARAQAHQSFACTIQ